MKPYKIVLALLITFAIIIGVRYNTTHKFLPIEKKAYVEGWVLTHKFSHLFYYSDSADAVLTVELEGGQLPEGYTINFYYKSENISGYRGEIAYSRHEMKPTVSNSDQYEIIITNQGRGTKIFYYIELNDPQGNAVALTKPGTESDKTAWFMFAHNPPAWLLGAHLAFMFAGFLFLSLAFITSFEDLHNSVSNSRVGRQILWTVIFLLIGIFPLGMWMQYDVLGTYYHGWPFGRDIANTLAVIVFIYWLLILILMKGSGFAARPSKNWIPPVAARALTIIGFFASIGLFLVPHNIGEF